MTTFASIAGITLPSDRVYDGVDLTDVLTKGADVGHTTMFHPKTDGVIAAVRYNNYKGQSLIYIYKSKQKPKAKSKTLPTPA